MLRECERIFIWFVYCTISPQLLPGRSSSALTHFFFYNISKVIVSIVLATENSTNRRGSFVSASLFDLLTYTSGIFVSHGVFISEDSLFIVLCLMGQGQHEQNCARQSIACAMTAGYFLRLPSICYFSYSFSV